MGVVRELSGVRRREGVDYGVDRGRARLVFLLATPHSALMSPQASNVNYPCYANDTTQSWSGRLCTGTSGGLLAEWLLGYPSRSTACRRPRLLAPRYSSASVFISTAQKYRNACWRPLTLRLQFRNLVRATTGDVPELQRRRMHEPATVSCRFFPVLVDTLYRVTHHLQS
jgi:hypothetical protein